MAGFFDNLRRTFDRDGGKSIGGSFNKLAKETGVDKKNLASFMKMSGSLQSNSFKQNDERKITQSFGVQQQSRLRNKKDLAREKAAGTNQFTTEYSAGQIKGFVEAFVDRQSEVFERRARPGAARQTRLV